MTRRYALAEIDAVAQWLIHTSGPAVWAFQGEMGAGKTTLIAALAKALGIADHVSSPTFGLVHEYRTPSGQPVYHFDCYRLKHPAEALDFGIEEYLYSENPCWIEWPDKLGNLLPQQLRTIQLEWIDQDTRQLTLTDSA
jgi:tRNA threonylcarbamoyladenosine biosynthesis protein TsaE